MKQPGKSQSQADGLGADLESGGVGGLSQGKTKTPRAFVRTLSLVLRWHWLQDTQEARLLACITSPHIPTIVLNFTFPLLLPPILSLSVTVPVNRR